MDGELKAGGKRLADLIRRHEKPFTMVDAGRMEFGLLRIRPIIS